MKVIKFLIKAMILISAVVLFFACLSRCPKMTEEEMAAYREKHINRYEVCSVSQYIKPITNQFGGVERTEMCYAFSYIDGSGALHTVNDFRNIPYGLQKLRIGDKNQYVVDSTGETIRYLYLTKDTMSAISGGLQ